MISSSGLLHFLNHSHSQGFSGNKPCRKEKIEHAERVLTESAGAFLPSSVPSIVGTVNSAIENRGGFAWLTGLVMVPSQFLCPKAAVANQVIAEAAESGNGKIERFSLPVKGTDTSVEGVIYYPRDWNQSDCSRSVLYHNPNGATVSRFFKDGRLSWTPAEILKLAKCPIVMYDYRGTGLSSENRCMGSLAFRPTYATIAVDGETVLRFALEHFQSVNVIGSSLGGGVATISLERHLKANSADAGRVSLTNHDSFSTTPQVVMPGWPRTANWVGWALGGLLDVETSMKSLVGRGISITVLCHDQDPIIPRGARMAEFIERLPRKRNVSVIHSPEYGHANLSQDMVRELYCAREGFLNLNASETKQNRSEAVRPTSPGAPKQRIVFGDGAKEISEGNISEDCGIEKKGPRMDRFSRGADRFGEVAARPNFKKPTARSIGRI